MLWRTRSPFHQGHGALLALAVTGCATTTADSVRTTAETTPEPKSVGVTSTGAQPAATDPPRDVAWYSEVSGGCQHSEATSDALPTKERLLQEWLPSPTPGEQRPFGPDLRPSLSKDQIRHAIETQIDAVRWCYESGLSVWPHAAGRIVVTLRIGPSGTVTHARQTENSTGVVEIGCCIENKVIGWHFPKPEGGGEVIVSYPFRLEARDESSPSSADDVQ